MALTSKLASPAGEDTERSILDIAPEQEALDWICYRVRGGVDPANEQPAPKPPAVSADLLRRRPEREDIEKALARLVELGMLSYDGRRWSMTSKAQTAM